MADRPNLSIGRVSVLSGPAYDPSSFTSYVRASRASSDQAVTATTLTVVAFNAESSDSLNEFDTSTQFGFYPKVAGDYAIRSTIRITNSSAPADSVTAEIYKNGAPAYTLLEESLAAGVTVTRTVSVEERLVASSGGANGFQITVTTTQNMTIKQTATSLEVKRIVGRSG